MLPSLPKQIKKREADFGLVFRTWITKHPQVSSAWELKQTTADSISFSCVEDQQLLWLEAINSSKGALIRVQGTSGQPDYLYLRNAPAHIFIKFPKVWCAITISTWILEKERSKRKSLTVDRAREIAVKVVSLK